MEPRTVALLHEEPWTRDHILAWFNEQPGYKVLSGSPDIPAFKRAMAMGAQPTITLLSLEAATADRYALLYWVAQHVPGTRTLLIGRHPDPTDLICALRAGAQGYYCTRDTKEMLGKVVEQLMHGALHFSASTQQAIRERLPTHEEAAPSPTPDPPTDRQLTVLRLLADPNEYTYAQIAERMGEQTAVPCAPAVRPGQAYSLL